MTFHCGVNERSEPVKGSAEGLATEQEAIGAAFSDAAWTVVDAVFAITDWAHSDTCPAACPKQRLPKPRFTVVTFTTAQVADGRWSCDVDLRLTGFLRCTQDVEVALLDDRELPVLATVEPIQKVLNDPLPPS